jgi:hypothetical protein
MDTNIINNINFREKSRGWKKSGATIHSFKYGITEHGDIFVQGFLKNIYLRPACYECKVKSLKSGSDITLGDYWGIQDILPDFDDDKGVSLVMVNTLKGKCLYEMLKKVETRETSYSDALAGNPSLEKSAVLPSSKRGIFFAKWRNKSTITLIIRLTNVSLCQYIRNKTAALVSLPLRQMSLLTAVKSLVKKHE